MNQVVILPRGTNTPLEETFGARGFLWAKNKWLICHEENNGLRERGAWPGIYGENWKVSPLG